MDSIAPFPCSLKCSHDRIEANLAKPIWLSISITILLTLLCYPLVAQENYLVSTNDGLVGLYDLATNSLIESTKGSLGFSQALGQQGEGAPVPGPNSRLAFVASSEYVSTIDLTINREVKRLKSYGVYFTFSPRATITADGKLLLVVGFACTTQTCGPTLVVIDTAQLFVLKVVDLSTAIQSAGAIVALTSKVYVFAGSSNDNAAVVNLTNYSVSSITLPSGSFTSPHMAAATPDGSLVVAFKVEKVDRKSHTILISTATDTVVGDIAQSSDYTTRSLVITPNGSDPSKIFGYVSGGINSQTAVAALDLRANSPTYGQLLTDTTVVLDGYFAIDATAINSDGSRLLIGGYTYGNASNVNVIDTAKMFTDPAHAIIAQLTLNLGNEVTGLCTGFFSTTPPNTAPTVSGVS